MPELTCALDSLSGATAALQHVTGSFPALDDAALLSTQSALAESRRRIDAASAVAAAEIARRSHHDLGTDGLARRLGARSPEALVQQLTGTSRRDATTLVRVGALLEVLPADQPADAPPVPSATPWLRCVMERVAAGELSLEAADVISFGLGTPTDTVPVAALAAAAQQLAEAAPAITLERLAALARELRDEIDEAGIAEREHQRRQRRYLTLRPQTDGMVAISGLLDPESAALVVDAFDTVTSPRRGGPRFVKAEDLARAEAIENDPRTLGQQMLDAFVEMVRIAAESDATHLFGRHRPAVRVLVTDRDLARRGSAGGHGAGRFEGQPDAVSIATVERFVCEVGVVPVSFDENGQALDLGITRRLFSSRQRVALAARDGGCRFPGCDRPPSWTEAHHIIHWEHGGPTNVADGILLCRRHHLDLHNYGYHITRENADYTLHPPESVDPHRVPIPIPSRSAAWNTMRTAEREPEREPARA